mmetsp:Transcript_116032/g.335071  ORF Transcript_116032/g.335071 Transcript_116032/m.335071 type:complete len:387 (+) Transcript_116032:1198-2358(+)
MQRCRRHADLDLLRDHLLCTLPQRRPELCHVRPHLFDQFGMEVVRLGEFALLVQIVAAARRRVAKQGVDASGHRRADASQVVAALEDYYNAAVGKLHQSARERMVPSRRHAATAKRVPKSGVETCTDDDEIRLEVVRNRHQHMLPSMQVLGIARRRVAPLLSLPPLPWHIDRVTGTLPRAVAGEVALGSAGKESPRVISMDGEEQHRTVLVEHVLRSVAVVYVPINDERPLRPTSMLSLRNRHADVAKHAEAHCALGLRVVTWWSHDADRLGEVSTTDSFRRLQHCASGEQRRFQRLRAQKDTSVLSLLNRRLLLGHAVHSQHGLHMLGRMRQQQLLFGRQPARHADATVNQAFALQVLEDARDASRLLWVLVVILIAVPDHARIV